jgi:plastocyanin
MADKVTKALCAGALILLAGLAPAVFAGHPGNLDPAIAADRFLPRPPGVDKPMVFYFGPFTIPPGQDFNRITVDVPVHNGFVTAIAPSLWDASTNQEPSHLEMHIHHAHWFRLSQDPGDEYYTLNLAWVFGTGEEQTQGSFNDRSAAEPGGPRYGIFMPGGQPQAMIFMVHNKVPTPRVVYISLSVEFVYGTAAEIAAAQDCGIVLMPRESCAAGQRFHEVKGRLWGSTFDVPRQADGDGIYVHPRDIEPGNPDLALGKWFKAPSSGTLVATAGHLHANGIETVIANLGPAGSGCEADLDGDGFAGVTLFRSRKLDRVEAAWPHSDEYQMAASKFGFRAPIREGDRITQFGVYANKDYASYAAMSFVGIYVDRQAPPQPYGPEGCDLAALRSYLVDQPGADARWGILNHPWHTFALPLCGIEGYPACDLPAQPRPQGMEVPAVHIGAFAYLPGDLQMGGQLGAPPRVQAGEALTFINEDAGAGIRHSVTSCRWPCNGPYTANYPQPDGRFDSGLLGNLDYIDGGLVTQEANPVWATPPDLQPGLYSYYCRIHPTMRGAFEVVAA